MLQLFLFVTTYIAGFLLTIFTGYSAISFVLYEVVYFFNPAERWWAYALPDVSYSFIAVMLMFFALAIKTLRHQSNNKILAVPQLKYIYILLMLYAFAWTYAVFPENHITALINYLKLVITLTVAYKLIDSLKQLDFVMWGYIFGCWYISFLTFQTGRNRGIRVEGIGTVDSPDANGIAAAIAPGIVICFYYFWVTKPKLRMMIYVLAGVFIANALILINSRAAILAVAVSMSYFLYRVYYSRQRRKFQRLIAILIVLLGFGGVAYLSDDTFLARVATMKEVEIVKEQETGTTRFLFWLSAIKMSLDYPFGQGFHGFDYHAPEYIPPDVNTGGARNRSVHSTWFEVLTEIGYPGLLTFGILIYVCFISTRQCRLRLDADRDYAGYFRIVALEAALIAYIVAMSFMNRFRAEILYWLILYTMCAYNLYVVKRTPSRSSKNSVKIARMIEPDRKATGEDKGVTNSPIR